MLSTLVKVSHTCYRISGPGACHVAQASLSTILLPVTSASEVFDLQLVNGVVETNNQAHKPDSGLLRHFGNLAGILATSTRCIETAHFVGCRI